MLSFLIEMDADINPYRNLSHSLQTAFVGKKVIYYPQLASTMDAARREAQRGASEGTVIIAGAQTGGRGRMKRTWLSPQGNIALSIILRPDVSYLPYLVMLASLAVVRSIEAVTGLKPKIKWPNDILIGGKKVCGILTELSAEQDMVDYVLVGVGLNANVKVNQFPKMLQSQVTSIQKEFARKIDRVAFTQRFFEEFEKMYLAFTSDPSRKTT